MKDFFCRLFAPWKAGDQFESADAFYGFSFAENGAADYDDGAVGDGFLPAFFFEFFP